MRLRSPQLGQRPASGPSAGGASPTAIRWPQLRQRSTGGGSECSAIGGASRPACFSQSTSRSAFAAIGVDGSRRERAAAYLELVLEAHAAAQLPALACPLV